ncbi:hypothetical protein WMF11_48895 [Sorangium sp. So ce295]|uniref:hypothetical protein n=1 Tax=Sorangium sp. So ce295 TaxID=3133295 RepID=UPI003F627D53
MANTKPVIKLAELLGAGAEICDNYDLAGDFAMLRELLFPEWIDGQSWEVREGHHPDCPWCDGYCHDETRTIWVARPRNGAVRIRTLVHEMVHASRGIAGHEEPFLDALATVADRAANTGRRDLEDMIRIEHSEWGRGETVVARDLYSDVEAARTHGLSFDDAVQKAATKRYTSVAALLAKYPRVRTLGPKGSQS